MRSRASLPMASAHAGTCSASALVLLASRAGLVEQAALLGHVGREEHDPRELVARRDGPHLDLQDARLRLAREQHHRARREVDDRRPRVRRTPEREMIHCSRAADSGSPSSVSG